MCVYVSPGIDCNGVNMTEEEKIKLQIYDLQEEIEELVRQAKAKQQQIAALKQALQKLNSSDTKALKKELAQK